MGSEIQRAESSSSSTNKQHANCSNGNSSNNSSSSPTLGATDGIAELAIFIDEHDVLNGAREVLHTIRPSWRDENIQFKVSDNR